MKKLYLLLPLFAGLLLTNILHAQPNKKIITMNVHCYQDNWEFRFQQILDHLVALDPDIISFQEVCTNPATKASQVEYIRSYLQYRGYPVNSLEEQYTHPAWDQYDEYILMVSKHHSQKVDKGLLPKSLLQRGYIALNIDNHWYINVHLEFRHDNSHYRKAQFDYLQNRFVDLPHIIMGDFNSSPESSEQRGLWASRYVAVFPGPSHLGNDGNQSNKIDGYWISPQSQYQISNYEGKVILNQRVQDQYLSDHFAIFLNINFRQ